MRDNVEVGFFTDSTVCVSRFDWIAVEKVSGRDPSRFLPRRRNADFQSVSAEKHPRLWIRQDGNLSHQSVRMPQLQNHALYMRVNVEGRRAQKTDERLVAVARQFDRKT